MPSENFKAVNTSVRKQSWKTKTPEKNEILLVFWWDKKSKQWDWTLKRAETSGSPQIQHFQSVDQGFPFGTRMSELEDLRIVN